MGDALRITVIATGFDRAEPEKTADLQMGGNTVARRGGFTETVRPFSAMNTQSAPASAANAFSARTYAEPEKAPDPVMNEPEPRQEQPLYRDPSAGLRRDYNERPANKLDIPAFLRK